MSKVLITGGAGFIGSNLADRLIADGDNVTIVDDLSMGLKENVPASNRITFYEKSIMDYDFMEQLLLKNDFDYIYLLAAIASVADTIERPYTSHFVNQDANLNILEILRRNKLNPKRVLFSSSAAVYGNEKTLPKKETSPISPESPYAIDKFATERFVLKYGKLYNLNTTATRFFNVYGPKQNPKSPYSGVISIITDKLKKGGTFNLFGDGEQMRDFVFIDDVIDALLILSRKSSSLHKVFNVATGNSVTLNEMIQVMEQISRRKLIIKKEDFRIGDIKKSSADISRLESLGFTARNSIKSGLEKYWKGI